MVIEKQMPGLEECAFRLRTSRAKKWLRKRPIVKLFVESLAWSFLHDLFLNIFFYWNSLQYSVLVTWGPYNGFTEFSYVVWDYLGALGGCGLFKPHWFGLGRDYSYMVQSYLVKKEISNITLNDFTSLDLEHSKSKYLCLGYNPWILLAFPSNLGFSVTNEFLLVNRAKGIQKCKRTPPILVVKTQCGHVKLCQLRCSLCL